LLVMCPHADCFLSLSVCLSVSLSISLYVYSVYDFYNNNNIGMDETSDSDYRLLNNTNNSLSYG